MPEFLTPNIAGPGVVITPLPLTNFIFFTFNIGSPGAIGANTTTELSFVLTIPANVQAGSIVIVSKPTAQAGLGIVGARTSGGTLFITFSNNTGVGITPTASEIYSVLIIQ